MAFCENKIKEVEIDLPLNLTIPEPIVIKQNNTNYYAWDLNGLGIITKVFVGYNYWAENTKNEKELKNIFNLKIKIYEERFLLKDEIIKDLKEDREHIYNLYNSEIKKTEKAIVKNNFKSIGLVLSSGIVGIAIGIIVGILIIK